MPFYRVNIDGNELLAAPKQTIRDVAEANGIDIPTLCHDPKLQNYASCGLCVVEVEGLPKLVRSCSTEISDGMIVNTNTPKVRESRKTTLELFLSNHSGDCKAPCTLGCPDQVDIQGYVGLTANGEFLEALKLIKQDLPLPACVGRVCPHPCQSACRRGLVEDAIQIAWIKRYVADLDLQSAHPYVPEIAPSTGKKVAIVGGGPSGISAAYFLRRQGHAVVIFEANSEFGGMLHYGIPMYRLPKDIVAKEVDILRRMGVELRHNTRLGTDITMKYLRDNYDAVYLAVGAWKSSRMNIPGESLKSIYGGINFLTNFARNTPIRTGRTIAVLGGGNTAMDAARTSIRLGAEKVYLLYRRTKEEMPAIGVEIREAEEEGVEFRFLVNPVEFIGDENGRVCRIKLQHMQITEADAKGRRNVVPIENAYEYLDVDSVIMSIGQQTILDGLDGVQANPHGQIQVDPNTFQTNLPGVFAGGDAIDNKLKIAIQAIADGKHAAKVMHSYLLGELTAHKTPYFVVKDNMTYEKIGKPPVKDKAHMAHLDPFIRINNFEEVVGGFTEDEATYEGNRCLECGCMDYHECDLFKRANQYAVRPERLAGEKVHLEVEQDHAHILRDPDKCILCGMCVRVCAEVMDNEALGLVQRGFDTHVEPALGRRLSDTSCISCGQCVSICPVGALQEKRPIHKQVPLQPEVTNSACAGCGVGCNLNIETKGDMILRMQPVKEDKVSGGILCEKGRFDYENYQPKERLTQPMIRRDGKLIPVSFDEAILQLARKAQSIQLLYNQNALGIAISDMYTNEEMYLAKKLAFEILKTDHIFSLGYHDSGLSETLGDDASTVRFEELEHSDLIMVVGGDIFRTHTIAALKMKRSVDVKHQLVTINTKATKLDEWATEVIRVPDQRAFLEEVVKALIDLNPECKTEGFEELKQHLQAVTVTDRARELALKYQHVKKAILVYNKECMSLAEQTLLADMAILSTHIGLPRSGILQLKENVNSQGIADMGLGFDRSRELGMIESGVIKAMISFGEELPLEHIRKLKFLAVQTATMTETAEQADVIIPAATLAESEGFVTSSERRVQPVRPCRKPLLGMTNFDIFKKIMWTFDSHSSFITREKILEEISEFNPDYRGIHHLKDQSFYWPTRSGVQLYWDGQYRTPSGKARLLTP